MNPMVVVIAVIVAVHIAITFREARAIGKTVGKRKRSNRYIYFIRGRGENPFLVKIGRTNNYKRRMKAHSTANPYGVYVLGVLCVRDDKGAERFLHQKFAGICIQREWFFLTPLLLFTIFYIRDKKLTRDANAHKST